MRRTTDGLRWRFEGREHRLVLRPGQSTVIPHPSQSMQPRPIEARATLVR